jgi:DNA-binding beta-propeller fold protein YncE
LNPFRDNLRSGLATLLILMPFLLSACRGQAVGLARPTGVAVLPDGSLYIMDHVDRSHSRVVHTTPTGKVEAVFQPKDQKTGLVYSGWDIAIGPHPIVYYGNLISNDERTLHDSILTFDLQGQFLVEFGAYDYSVGSSELAHLPYNLDVDNGGRIYVSDFNYNEVRVFDAQGHLLTVFTKDTVEHFNYQGIGDVVVDDRRGLLYLVDYFAGRLDQYRRTILPGGTPQLAYQWSVGEYGHGPHEFSFPQYLAVDETTGIVYVGDMGNRRIVTVDAQGNFTGAFSPPEVDEWQVLGLTVGADAERPGDQAVYAADAFNRVIWAFKSDGQFLRKIEVH